jgi:hypothetical protein
MVRTRRELRAEVVRLRRDLVKLARDAGSDRLEMRRERALLYDKIKTLRKRLDLDDRGAAIAALQSEPVEDLRRQIDGLKRRELERQVRDQTIIERSGRVSELMRQNAESRAALANQHLEQAFGQRDARLALLESKLEMLLHHLSLSDTGLPRGL